MWKLDRDTDRLAGKATVSYKVFLFQGISEDKGSPRISRQTNGGEKKKKLRGEHKSNKTIHKNNNTHRSSLPQFSEPFPVRKPTCEVEPKVQRW